MNSSWCCYSWPLLIHCTMHRKCVKRFTSWKVESTSIWSISLMDSTEENCLCSMNGFPSLPMMMSSQVSMLAQSPTPRRLLSRLNIILPWSVQTVATATVPGTSIRCVPPDSAVSWFCPVPAAGRMDTRPAAPHVRAKDRRATLLLVTRRSASAPVGVQESLKMCSFTVSRAIEYRRDSASEFWSAF